MTVWKKGIQLDAWCRLGAQYTGQLRCGSYSSLMGDGGLLRGPDLQLGALCCPWGAGKWPRETGRKFGSPQRALSTCFLTAGEASAQSRFTRGRKGRAVFFLPFPFSACPSASVGLVSAFPAPSLLPHTVCVSVCLCYVFSMSPDHPSCLNPTPRYQDHHPWAQDFGLASKHIFLPVPGQPGQSGLIFNPCFHLT